MIARFSANNTTQKKRSLAYNKTTPTLQSSMQIVLPPEVEALVQRQLTSGKYQNAIEVILAGIKLLEQQEDIYQGRLSELQEEVRIGWEASRRGEVRDGSMAMEQIRAKVRTRYNGPDDET